MPQNWWEFAVNYAVHVYNCTPLKHASNDYRTPFERLQCKKPDVAHLRVFGCGAYVFLPEDIRTNNLSPRSELMTFIGLSEGTKGYIFMRSPNNVVFTAIQALFDEMLFPKCPNMHQPGFTPVGLPPTDQQGEHNTPPDDENEDHGGDLPQVPLQPRAIPPQPPAQYYPPLPPSSPSSEAPSFKRKGRALSPEPFRPAPSSEDDDMYMPRPMMPQVPQGPPPPVTPRGRYRTMNPRNSPYNPKQAYGDRSYQIDPSGRIHVEQPYFAPRAP